MGWARVWMGVVCPCPPVCNDIVTPRHLLCSISSGTPPIIQCTGIKLSLPRSHQSCLNLWLNLKLLIYVYWKPTIFSSYFFSFFFSCIQTQNKYNYKSRSQLAEVGKEVRPTSRWFTIEIFSSYVEKHDVS